MEEGGKYEWHGGGGGGGVERGRESSQEEEAWWRKRAGSDVQKERVSKVVMDERRSKRWW